MIPVKEQPPFPYYLIWEELEPRSIDWEDLALDLERFDAFASLAALTALKLPEFSHSRLRDMARAALAREGSDELVSKLYLLAGWQLTPEVRRQLNTDIKGNRAALRNVERLARELAHATSHLSGDMSAVLDFLHGADPERLMSTKTNLVGRTTRAAMDLSRVAGRAYAETAPKRTGRLGEMRRDNTVRLGAEVIEQETGVSISTSRGNKDCASPHFTNTGGHLLRAFFKLVAPKVDEALLVGSLKRVRKLAKAAKKLPV